MLRFTGVLFWLNEYRIDGIPAEIGRVWLSVWVEDAGESVRRRPSKDAELAFNRGYLAQGLNDHEAAIEAFERAIALKPDHDRALYGLGLSLISLRRLDEAATASV